MLNEGAGPAVWVVDADGRPVLRPVTVAAYEARDVLVTGGVAEGDKVVALGVQKLDPGPARSGSLQALAVLRSWLGDARP